MDFLHRGWNWLNDEPSAVAVLATAIVAFALLTAFATVVRRSGGERRLAPVRSEDADRIPGHEAMLDSAEMTQAELERPRSGRRLQRKVSLLGRRLRRSRKIRDNILFLSRVATAPRNMGSVAPSSRRLGRAMAAELPEDYDLCVELGGGTGSLTQAILAAGMPREKLVVIERDPRFVEHLRSRFRGVKVLQGDAQDLRELLRAEGIGGRVDAVVSGLPLRSLPKNVCHEIITECFEALSEGGIYVQFTYGLTPPVARWIASGLDLVAEAKSRVWRNLPPATVWRYSRKGE